MSKYGAQRVTTETSKGEITFRSKLEYHFSVYLEFLERSGEIIDWEYEPQKYLFEFQHGRHNNTRKYLPDFMLITKGYDTEIIECKGAFSAIDATKCKKFAEAHDEPLVLLFEHLTDCKSLRTQYNRAKRLEPHINRVIYDARKTIFEPIKHLFEY